MKSVKRGNNKVSIGWRIRRLRGERGLTQEDLARACEVTVGQVSKWERGRGEPRASSLRALARALKTSVDALVGLTEV